MTATSELLAWQNGTPTGGPSGDGRYPLTYKDGVVYLVYCPAAQALNPALAEQPIEVFAETAGNAANDAEAAATDAEAAKIAAQTSAANAATSATNALASKNAAATSATNAATSATTAGTHKTAAQAAQTAAETARDEAEAAAASFSAGDYVTTATTQIITGVKTYDADLKISATFNLLIGTQSGGAVGQVRIEHASSARVCYTSTGSRRYSVGTDTNKFTIRDESAGADRVSMSSTGVMDFAVAPTVASNAVWHSGTFDPATKQDVTANLTAWNALATSSKLDASEVAEASTVSKVVKRNSAGDINTRLFRAEFGDQTTMSGAIAYRINNTTDNYTRYCSNPTAIKTWLGMTMAEVTDLPTVTPTAGTANSIVQRTSLGYITNSYFNTTAAFVGAAQPTAVFVETSSDGYIRKQTPADYKKQTMGIQNVTSAATVTPTTDNDIVAVTAQAAALAIANPTGSTPVQGQGIVLRIKDNGTARAISWGTIYRAMGVTLPTTTVAGKTMYIGLIYNATDTKWDVISVVKEA